MDGFELNKVAGAILLAGVIAMLTGFVSRILIPEPHMEESVIVASGAEAESDGAPAEAEPQSIGPLLASASVEEGEKAARKCAACHTFEQGGPNRVGPNLWNVVGAEKAHLDNFSYSAAMAEAEGEWTYEELDAFLANPRAALPGTKMAFAGLSRVEERANVIAYLRSLSDDPLPLPEAAAEAPAEQQEGAAEGEGAAEQEQPEAAASEQGEAQEGQPQVQGGETAPAAEQQSDREQPQGQQESEQQQSEQQQSEQQPSETQGETEQPAAEAPAAEQSTEPAQAPAEQQAEAPAGAAAEGAGSDQLVAMIKEATPEDGAKVARKCVACHTFDKDAGNRVGPNLWGVIGGPVAHREDFRYSKAMEEHGGEWTYEALSEYLEQPRSYIPGNKMTFAGLKKPEERAAIIAYMRTMADSPPPLD